eukprot:CAMPEP_0176473164 /NCGR_PEP_ID=MMETSP0127-20121128/42148_1 /TAXON_ID=938130 /ORGANISM="Platyophrya macrostoma, Strain WH" /LENGTH=463 /DNA_ID=CAMNT_0017868117 /DNA_START=1 /DNA_END=1388 /DNA_ORIENTATION=-
MLNGQDFSSIQLPPPSRPNSQRSSSRRAADDGDNGSMLSALMTNATDLFGAYFHTLRNELATVGVSDPEELDTLSTVRSTFGSHYEKQVDIEPVQPDADILVNLIREARTASFEDMSSWARDETLPAPALGMLKATVPEVSKVHKSALASLHQGHKLWLMELAKVDPNRQTLHADPTICLPDVIQPLLSSERRLFTTQNVMRWSYTAKSQTPVSNTRMVRWSDGSWTLHVVAPNLVYSGSVSVNAMTAVQGFDERVAVKTLSAPSIRDALVAENMRHRATDVHQRLGVPTAQAFPEFEATGQLEQFVKRERANRQQWFLERAKAGCPVTLAEQIEAEQQMFERMRNASAQELHAEQEEEARARALHTHGGARPSGRRMRESHITGAYADTWEGILNEAEASETPQEDAVEDAEAAAKKRRVESSYFSSSPPPSAETSVERKQCLSHLRQSLPVPSEAGDLIDS